MKFEFQLWGTKVNCSMYISEYLNHKPFCHFSIERSAPGSIRKIPFEGYLEFSFNKEDQRVNCLGGMFTRTDNRASITSKMYSEISQVLRDQATELFSVKENLTTIENEYKLSKKEQIKRKIEELKKELEELEKSLKEV